MKLQVFKREKIKKSESNKIRREGNIPAVIYTRGKESQAISVDGAEFGSFLRSVMPGRLSTSVFMLKDDHGKQMRAIVKDIQYHPTSYKVLHMDFEELFDDVPVKVNVPIECTGVVDCIGVKLGGILRQVVRHLRIRCLPKDIPSAFTIDVKAMGQNEKKRLSDLSIPQAVKPMADLNEVAVVIAKR